MFKNFKDAVEESLRLWDANKAAQGKISRHASIGLTETQFAAYEDKDVWPENVLPCRFGIPMFIQPSWVSGALIFGVYTYEYTDTEGVLVAYVIGTRQFCANVHENLRRQEYNFKVALPESEAWVERKMNELRDRELANQAAGEPS